MTMEDPIQLLDKLANTSHQSFKDEETRVKALQQAQKLVRRLETPLDAVVRMMWIDGSIHLSFKVLADTGVFKELSTGPKTTDELAKTTGADPELLRRFLRQLAATTYVNEKDEDLWAPTEMTNAMANGMACTNDFLADLELPAYWALPSYLKEIGYKNPSDQQRGAFQKGHRTDLSFFDYLGKNPATGTAFSETMRVTQVPKLPWFEIYPIRERLIPRFDSSISDVLLVDVGGGTGYDLINFREAFSDHKGKLVLQDRKSVIEEAPNHEGIEKQAHSIFEPQPVKGAAAYFMGSVLHNWADEQSRQILSHLRDALKPGYSRIILREPVLPPKGASLMYTSIDLQLMMLFASKERTRKDWDRLAASAGLKVSDVWAEWPGAPRFTIELILEGDSV